MFEKFLDKLKLLKWAMIHLVLSRKHQSLFFFFSLVKTSSVSHVALQMSCCSLISIYTLHSLKQMFARFSTKIAYEYWFSVRFCPQKGIFNTLLFLAWYLCITHLASSAKVVAFSH